MPARHRMTEGTTEFEQFFEAARTGDTATLRSLIELGFDVNARESGDNTYAMHWAAAAGHLEAVTLLADAGGDVTGEGDDHELQVIGWATSWDECADDVHRAIADFLVSRGARHHIFSAIAMDLEDEVRRLVAENPSVLSARMSRNESHQTPLHFAVRMNRPRMVSLLLELGADPLALDGSGQPVATYAESKDADQRVMEEIAARLPLPHARRLELLAMLSLERWDDASRLLVEDPALLDSGVLHLMAKRGDSASARWLLDMGADPNARWAHFDAEVTPLHMVSFSGNSEIAQLLLDAGGDPSIRDSLHDGDATGWAEHFGWIDLHTLFSRHHAR